MNSFTGAFFNDFAKFCECLVHETQDISEKPLM